MKCREVWVRGLRTLGPPYPIGDGVERIDYTIGGERLHGRPLVVAVGDDEHRAAGGAGGGDVVDGIADHQHARSDDPEPGGRQQQGRCQRHSTLRRHPGEARVPL